MTRSFIVLGFILSTNALTGQVPPKLAEEVAAMAKIGSCSAPGFTPDGKSIVFISNISGSPQLWKVPAAGGWPVQLTSFNDPVTDVSVSPKGDRVAFVLAPGGGLNAQVHTMNLSGMDMKMITAGGNVNNNLGIWSNDGEILTYQSNVKNKDALDCFTYNVKTGTSSLLCENRGTGGVSGISGDKTKYLVSRLKSRGSNDLYLVDIVTKTEKLLTKHDGPGTFFGMLDREGNVLLASNKDSDFIQFGRLINDQFKPLAKRTSEELIGAVLNKAKTSVILIWSDAGKTKLSLLDLQTDKEELMPNFPVEIVSSVSFSPDDSKIVFTGSGSTEPANIWIYDFTSKAFQKLTESPHAGVDLTTMVMPDLVRFKSFDGVELNGWLYTPPNTKGPWPTVISYHGGPESISTPNFNISAQLLVRQGRAFFLPNVRGSSGFGKKFVNLDNGELRFNGVKDIKACYDYLINNNISKPGSVGIMGGSYGGYMVMAGVTEYPDMFAAGANLFGVVNFETFFAKTEPWMAAISTVEYGDPKTQADLLRRLSPIHKADKIKTPLIVLHGANDTNVPVVEAEQVVSAMKSRNVPVKYVLFPDEGHGWSKTNNRVTSTVEVINWFVDYLK